MKKLLMPLFLILALLSCKKELSPLEQALLLAGDNRPELEKVLFRYSRDAGDSLKLKAACFLIENMPYYYYYEGELLDRYRSYYQALHEHKGKRQVKPSVLLDSVKALHGDFSLGKLNVKFDILEIDSAYLCNNIEWAFRVWREQPWGKHVSFEDFCEYVLPYRIENEQLADWREDFYNRYNPLLDALRDSSAVDADDPIVALRFLMKQISDAKDVYFTTTSPAGIPHVGPATSLYKSGTCREITDYVVYVCRALGIPCHIDFVPVRGDDNVGHFWTSYSDKYKELYAQEFPDPIHQVRGSGMQRMAKVKVYRHTFSVNRAMEKEIMPMESEIFPFFMYPRVVDVTIPYAEHYTRRLAIPASDLYKSEKKPGIVYLCSSQRLDWGPVTFAAFDRKNIAFTNIQTDVVMRVAAWEDKRLEFLSDPFSVDKLSGKITYYACNDSVQDVTLYTKFREKAYEERMLGGVFEASDTPDFRESEVLHLITQVPRRLFTVATLSPGRKYRYVRYRGPEKSHCNLAEASFYENPDDTLALRGRAIGTPGCYQQDGSHEYTNAFDGNTETSFDYREESGGWTGLDLGAPKTIARIVYTPRNHDNYIRPGDTYELFYLDKDWKSLDKITNASDSLFYAKVPANTLLYLKNHSRGIQERIFTYEKGEQIWK